MGKIALLIGVSEYEPSLSPLPSATKDVEAMWRVLVHPDMGDFADEDVNVLKNPQRQEMEEAIFHLFNNRKRDDLLLFYFSGHGIIDESGNFYLSTNETRKLANNSLLTPTSVEASFLHKEINKSKSQRQVLILDCCFSGAMAKGMTVKDDGSVNLQECLGGKGRAILTSSTSTQYSIVSEESELSIYTRYIVEGIETGAADHDEDGWISVAGLHEYASAKVQEAAPAMTPKFYPVEEGYKINLAKAPIGDPKLAYRRKVEEIAREDNGEISKLNYIYLDELCAILNLSEEEADEIEAEVLEPYYIRKNKLERYRQVFSQAIQKQNPISESDQKSLKRLQQVLQLRDEDIVKICEDISNKESEKKRVKAGNNPHGSQPGNTGNGSQKKIYPPIVTYPKWVPIGCAGLLLFVLINFWPKKHPDQTNVQQPAEQFVNTTGTSVKMSDAVARIDVPTGVFNYGGSTSWATIRPTLDSKIQNLKPQFHLQYYQYPNKSVGSYTGVNMLIDGRIAFAQSSEPLREDEKQNAQTKGLHLEEIPIAMASSKVEFEFAMQKAQDFINLQLGLNPTGK